MEVQREEFDKLASSVRRIETALLGDDDLKVEGMAHKVHEHGEYIKGIEKWKNKGMGVLLAFSLIAMGLWEGFKFLIHKFF